MITKTQKAAIIKQGFSLPDIHNLPLDSNLDGVIIKDGTFIACKGYNEHRYLYPFLHSLDLVDNSDWIHDDTAIHITGGQLCGNVSAELDYPELRDDKELLTEAQIASLFTMRKVLEMYGSHEQIVEVLFNYISHKVNYGGKYNGLHFLNKFYPNIKTPAIAKHYHDLKNSFDNVCLRTSPKKSLPGLLHSKFNITSYNVQQSVNEIEQDFTKFANVVERNELHYFFQEQLEGVNGVCHVRGRRTERKFLYSASATQGDIVLGKQGKVKLEKDVLLQLKDIAMELAEDFNKSIQLEFVVQDNVLYIVQLRLLKNEPEEGVRLAVPDKALAFGKTFSHGSIDVNVEDILVVSKDGESNELLGKKALIVTNNVEFSHLLALSKVLKIPSMYATGKVDFNGAIAVKFVAYNKQSWIVKLDTKKKIVYKVVSDKINWKK